ncbi:DUF6082 family protein [Streptomyces sp. NPDC101455]|uniref:DUF6082 family protein n=1 Tax=Streptomyces sp. NPDC101455 TaxID=3366142 RepID=UPI00381F599C
MRTPFRRLSRRRRQEEPLLGLLRQLTQEIRHANLIQMHRILMEQADRAIADPVLAAAMSTLPGLAEQKRRQLLFANREFTALLLSHRVGCIDWSDLMGHLRVLCRNEVFAEYWRLTGDHRRSLSRHSVEAQVGEAVDLIMDELADDPDEWWVVGPSEGPSG